MFTDDVNTPLLFLSIFLAFAAKHVPREVLKSSNYSSIKLVENLLIALVVMPMGMYAMGFFDLVDSPATKYTSISFLAILLFFAIIEYVVKTECNECHTVKFKATLDKNKYICQKCFNLEPDLTQEEKIELTSKHTNTISNVFGLIVSFIGMLILFNLLLSSNKTDYPLTVGIWGILFIASGVLIRKNGEIQSHPTVIKSNDISSKEEFDPKDYPETPLSNILLSGLIFILFVAGFIAFGIEHNK